MGKGVMFKGVNPSVLRPFGWVVPPMDRAGMWGEDTCKRVCPYVFWIQTFGWVVPPVCCTDMIEQFCRYLGRCFPVRYVGLG